ncbi:MAG: hypothetical protein Dbin4_02120, partial [Alphaproteobacteria bacterium]|nr:hypothetical protein [Alphaproteobacteria bacterium]
LWEEATPDEVVENEGAFLPAPAGPSL